MAKAGRASRFPRLETTFGTTLSAEGELPSPQEEHPFLLNVSESILPFVLVDGDSPEQSLLVEQWSSGKEQLVLPTVRTRVSTEG